MEAAAAAEAGWTSTWQEEPNARGSESPPGYPSASLDAYPPEAPSSVSPPPWEQGHARSVRPSLTSVDLFEARPWNEIYPYQGDDYDDLRGFSSPRQLQQAMQVHTPQMAAELPPFRVPTMAPIGPGPSIGRVELLSDQGPAASATTSEGPSDAFTEWLIQLERRQEEKLMREAQLRFCNSGPQASLHDFRKWLITASREADEAMLTCMRRGQLRAWLLCVRRLTKLRLGLPEVSCEDLVSTTLPTEVKSCIEAFVGGKHVWGPISATRARKVAESAQRQLKRCEGVLRASALAALVTRYVHPAVVQAAEAGCMACYTEIPSDDVALQALFEVRASEPQSTKEVGFLLCAHLAIDGFEVEPKYHDPEYGLWRGFWVEKCNRLRLVIRW
mmetsp:Transcript_7630/g.13499  ORF Transcript_7630/g.13499 Transcript_7630/m.13499 type:complete len:388 (+) Transcript_7630:37-1200(+)